MSSRALFLPGFYISFTESGAIFGCAPAGNLARTRIIPLFDRRHDFTFSPRDCARVSGKATAKPSRDGPQKPRGAERRKAPLSWPRLRGAAAHLAIGALAFRRSTAALARASERSSSAQAVLHAINKQRRRYLRRQSHLSQAPGAPAVIPEGSIPGPPGSGVTSPARRNRTRSINRLSPVDAPDVSEMGGGYCHRRGKVKGFKFCSINQCVSRRRFPQKSAPRA